MSNVTLTSRPRPSFVYNGKTDSNGSANVLLNIRKTWRAKASTRRADPLVAGPRPHRAAVEIKRSFKLFLSTCTSRHPYIQPGQMIHLRAAD